MRKLGGTRELLSEDVRHQDPQKHKRGLPVLRHRRVRPMTIGKQ